jgi:tetratricopeptide (TPR) repeat protein
VVDTTLLTIHGFWSSPATWQRLSTIWDADQQLHGLRIDPFGYPSPKKPRLPLSTTRVPDYDDVAQTLATEYTVRLAEARDIAIVTHSQGGLILQRFLIWMLNESRGQELARIRTIVMLACPNGGSEYLRSIRHVLGLGHHPQAGNLEVLNRQIADTQRTVLQRIVNATGVDDHQCRIPFHVYAGGSDQVVTPASAQGAFPGASTLAGNHFSILDPAAAGNRTAETVKFHILTDPAGALITRRLPEDKPPPVSQGDSGWVLPLPAVVDVARPGGTVLRPPTGRLPDHVRGRDELVARLCTLARTPDGRAHVLAGLGGTGKSTVALSVAREMPSLGVPVWWVPVVGAGTVEAKLLILARELGASPGEVAEVLAGTRNAADLLWRFLENRDRWLLIFDNVDDLDALAVDGTEVGAGNGWIRPSTAGLIVVTSRESDPRAWGRHVEVHKVGWLDRITGGQILVDMAPGAGAPEDAAALSDRLGGLPLALFHAGSQLSSSFTPEQTFAGYALALDKRFREMMSQGTADQRAIVTSTWEMSLDALAAKGHPQARTLLRILSCLAPGVLIPARMLDLTVLGQVCPNGKDEAAEGMDALASVGLITASPGQPGTKSGWIVHRLVAETSRLRLDGEDLVRAGGIAVALVTRAAPRHRDQPKAWPAWIQIAPHLNSLYEYLADALADADLAALARVTASTAMAFAWAGSYLASQELTDSALGHSSRLGTDHPDVMSLRFRMASAQRLRGNYAEAERELQGLLADRLRVLGPDDPSTLSTRYEIDFVRLLQGQYERAEQEFRDLLADRLRILGPDRPATLATRNQIARVLAAKGQYEQAEQEFRELLADRLRILGPDHPSTLNSRYELARVRAARGQYEQAEQQYRDLLADRLRVQGPWHPSTLGVRYGIADVLAAQGEYEQAEQEFRELLADRLRILGPDHPSTLNTRYGIATVLEGLGHYDQAEQELRDLLADRLRVLGPDHPDTLATRESLTALERRKNAQSGGNQS